MMLSSTPEVTHRSAGKRSTRSYGADLRETPTDAAIERGVGRLPIGTVLHATYRIDELIATGGMGEIYRATHERLPTSVAVKVLPSGLAANQELAARFRAEASTMASLHHPHIIQIFDFNVLDDGTPYFVMELAEGGNLRQLTGAGRGLKPARVARIVHQLASALEAAHARQIIHRDLKPENVMLVPTGDDRDFVKLVDFGACKSDRSASLTPGPLLIGTPEFMAPEQALGRSEDVDHRTDQFGLAALAYTLMTGHEPFEAENHAAVLSQIAYHDPAPIGELIGRPHPSTDDVLRRGMAKDRDRRYSSVGEFAHAFSRAVLDDREAARFTPPLAVQKPPVFTTMAGAAAVLTPISTMPVVTGDDDQTIRLSRESDLEPRRPRRWPWVAAIALAIVALAALPFRRDLARHPREDVQSAYETLSGDASRALTFATVRVPALFGHRASPPPVSPSPTPQVVPLTTPRNGVQPAAPAP